MRKELTNKFGLHRQKGVITLMGVGGIVAALFAFELVMQYSKLKIIDHELDNYARSVAEVALRSEMALTKKGLESGGMSLAASEVMSNAVLAQVGYDASSDGLDGVDFDSLNKEITFGNFASDGHFYALGEENPDYAESAGFGTYKSNPRLALQEMIDSGGTDVDSLPKFNAVAVQLWTNDNFMGVYTPQGRALYGALPSDKECFCDVRYESCVGGELTKADILERLYPSEPPGLVKGLLGGLLGGGAFPEHSLTEAEADAIASAIAIPNSDARKNYCEYGFTATHPSRVDESKYPYIDFALRQGWIGIPPIEEDSGVILNLLAESNYSREDYSSSLGQLPIFIYDGADTLSNEAGLLTTVDELLVLLNPDSGSGSVFSENTDATNQKATDLDNNGENYRCSLLTANVDVSLLGGLTDTLGLTNDALAAPCDSLVPQVGALLNTLTDPLFELLGPLLSLLAGALDGLLDVLGLSADGLESILDNLLDPNVVVHDPLYIGRSGTCIYGTDSTNVTPQRCLYNSSNVTYQSCNYLLADDGSGMPNVGVPSPSLVNRLSIYLLGPVKDFSAGVESLNCEVEYFRYVQPAFRAGSWQEVN
ncbi:hypothetical protein [Thiomicrorhabdus xiamenensis]|uniref:Uncharacterized protein n=1 Tax=Thiomicrorhabdus xiamenensis TaxID=2739063 RepID=A0A7D4T073_9GAMM|nr:hypothetical protein [Thiomicrorhabdus xiamenensis]QKI88605.1 hypothetical protein HQN79_02965 [Thiomicrorhabdus xiamenensis]